MNSNIDEFDLFVEWSSGKLHGKALVDYNISRIKSIFKYNDKTRTITVNNMKYPCTFDLFIPTCASINVHDKIQEYKVNFGLDVLCKQMTDAEIKFIMLHEVSHLRKDLNVHDEFELSIEWIRSELQMQGYYGEELETAMNKIIAKIKLDLEKDKKDYSELSKLRDKCIKYIRKYEQSASHSSAIEFEADREAANKLGSQKDAVRTLKRLYSNDDMRLAVNEIRLENTYKSVVKKYDESKKKILNNSSLSPEKKQKKLDELEKGHKEFLYWYKRMTTDKIFANDFFRLERQSLREKDYVDASKKKRALKEQIYEEREKLYNNYLKKLRELSRKNLSRYQKNIVASHLKETYLLQLQDLQNFKKEQIRLINTKYNIGLDGFNNKLQTAIDYHRGSKADKNSRLKAIKDKWFEDNTTYLK